VGSSAGEQPGRPSGRPGLPQLQDDGIVSRRTGTGSDTARVPGDPGRTGPSANATDDLLTRGD